MRPPRPSSDVPRQRLQNQQIARPTLGTPVEVVSRLGAVQAQDYLAATWAVGLRMASATDATVERAIEEGSILRTHLMRGTLQFVAPADIGWMLELIAPRVIAGSAGRHRQLGLDERTLKRSNAAIARSVRAGEHLVRAELAAILERAGIATAGQRLIHLIAHAELAGVICSGPRRKKQVTFASLERRAPRRRALPRAKALAELARRYFTSRGPAALRDFVWWSGLTLADARSGLEAIAPALAREDREGESLWSAGGAVRAAKSAAWLLPAFDEFLVGYRDRGAVLDPRLTARLNAGGGMLNPSVVVDGRVAGVWRRTFEKDAVVIHLEPLRRWSRSDTRAIRAAADRYAAFLGRAARIVSIVR